MVSRDEAPFILLSSCDDRTPCGKLLSDRHKYMTHAPSSDTSTVLLLGRYRILERLGEARLATVYRAVDERLRRRVLVYILRKDLVGNEQIHQRFSVETNAIAQASNRTLLEVFDSGVINDRPYMITEEVIGQPLRAMLPLSVEHALNYTYQVALAISACRSRNLTHPPISSNNLVSIEDNRVKLLDGWFIPPDTGPLDLAHYRAPERASGQPSGSSSDVYALGMLLYELLSGQRLARGHDPWEVSQSHLTLQVPALAEVRPSLHLPALDQLLAYALERDPACRCPDVETFAQALHALMQEVATETQRLPNVPPVCVTAQPAMDYASTALASPMFKSAALLPSAEAPPIDLPMNRSPLHPLSHTELRRKFARQSALGWIVLLLLLIIVAGTSYFGASYLMDRFFAIELPRPTLPDLGIAWPDWLPGVDRGEVRIVTAADLNVRNQPGLNTEVIATLPSGTRVRVLAGPVIADNIPWLRVRTNYAGQSIDGWASANFLDPPE